VAVPRIAVKRIAVKGTWWRICRAGDDPFTWTADPDKIIAAVKRGHQVLDSIH